MSVSNALSGEVYDKVQSGVELTAPQEIGGSLLAVQSGPESNVGLKMRVSA